VRPLLKKGNSQHEHDSLKQDVLLDRKAPRWRGLRTGVGYTPRQSQSVRNVGLWLSTDKGASLSVPLPLGVDTDDAGYGDLHMRKNGEIVVVSYHGSHEGASIKQYVLRLGDEVAA
jgi:hypothetical protein